MSVIKSPIRPTHDIGNARFTSLATPSRGSAETSVWMVEIDPATPSTPHSLTREEVFVVVEGSAGVSIGGVCDDASVGDAIVVPVDTEFELINAGDGPLLLLCCMPVGGQATTSDGTTFTPPWAR